MSFRFMRVIVFFDLPVETSAEKTAYRQFRNFLIKEGFVMMQQSVYFKLALNGTTVDAIKKRVRNNVPSKGLVQMMVITEKQFANIDYLIGESQSKVIESTDRYIVI